MSLTRNQRQNLTCRPALEPLEDRLLLAICHVVRLADLPGGHDLGNGHARGSLRYCINFANSNPGPDTIDFNVTGTIQLTGELPHLSSDITMSGPGADLLHVRGPGWWASQIFRVSFGATVAISGITITHSYHQAGGPGGIYNLGTLVLKDCTVSDNSNYFSGSTGSGGAIQTRGTMTISGCTISNNEVFSIVEDRGGAIANMNVNSSDLGVLNIENSTISGNKIAIGFGGGIYNEGLLDIRFSTVTNNGGSPCCVDGRGIYNSGSLHLYNSIVAGNDTGPDVSGSYTGSDNLIGGDPMLGPLQNNGGHTMTHAVLPGSPALDAGDNTGAPAFDQRGTGFPRIVNGTVDIGAYEVQSSPMPSSGGVGRPAPSAKVQATGAPSILERAHAATNDHLFLILSTIDFESIS